MPRSFGSDINHSVLSDSYGSHVNRVQDSFCEKRMAPQVEREIDTIPPSNSSRNPYEGGSVCVVATGEGIYSSCSSSESTVLSFANSPGSIFENATPKLLPSTQRTVASSIRNGQSRPGMWSRHSNFAPCSTFMSLSILQPPADTSRVRPCPSRLGSEKVLRNCAVNLGWTRRSCGRGFGGIRSIGSVLKKEPSFFNGGFLTQSFV